MKSIFILIFGLFTALVYGQAGFTSFDNVKQASQESGHPIMLVFSGSDWCKPCIQLKKNVLDTPEFSKYSEGLQFMYLDFPYKKANKLSKEETARNESLAEKFNEKGAFPKVVLINADEQILGEIVYQKSMNTKAFISKIESILN